MNIKTFGQLIRDLRKTKKLTQTDLARLTGISQSRISKLERGKRHLHQHEWPTLRQHLDIRQEVPPERMDLPFPSRCFQVARPECFPTADGDFSVRFHRARKVFGKLASTCMQKVQARDDAKIALRFLNEACTDSAYEAMLWMQGLASGGQPCWHSLLRAGFRRLRVVDRQFKMSVGDVRHPCLQLPFIDGAILLFPQVNIDARKAYYRLDALVCVTRDKQRCWVDLEVDGGGHPGDFDHEREHDLGLPTIRLTKSDLLQPDLFERLLPRLVAFLSDGSSI